MLVSSISPQPSSSTCLPHCNASSPVGVRPPSMYTSYPELMSTFRLTSIATTMHWAPKSADACVMREGTRTAWLLMETLSAPSMLLMPPPTVNGMSMCSAMRRTRDESGSRLSTVAVISRKTSSSAPSWQYLTAFSTGSPASRRSRKLIPLTVRPSLMSKHGIILLASTAPPPSSPRA